MVACRLSITGNDIEEKSLRKVFDQITRDVPVGRGQHRDDRVLVDAAKPFEPRLNAHDAKSIRSCSRPLESFPNG